MDLSKCYLTNSYVCLVLRSLVLYTPPVTYIPSTRSHLLIRSNTNLGHSLVTNIQISEPVEANLIQTTIPSKLTMKIKFHRHYFALIHNVISHSLFSTPSWTLGIDTSCVFILFLTTAPRTFAVLCCTDGFAIHLVCSKLVSFPSRSPVPHATPTRLPTSGPLCSQTQ